MSTVSENATPRGPSLTPGELEKLLEASQFFGLLTPDLGGLLDAVAQAVSIALGDGCVVRLITPDGEALEVAASYHPDPSLRAATREAVGQRHAALEQGAWGSVIRERRPIRLTIDPSQPPGELSPGFAAFVSRHGVHAYMAAPLVARDRVIGGISLVRHGNRVPYGEEDERLLVELAHRASVAIDNARLLQSAHEMLAARELAQTQLRDSEAHFRALVSSLDDIVFEFDADGTYLNVWTADESLLAQPTGEILGRRVAEVLGESAATPFVDAFRRVLQTGKAELMEYQMEVLGGTRWFRARISPVPSKDGSYRTVCMLPRDVTARRQEEEALRQAELDRLSALERIKDTLVGAIGAISATSEVRDPYTAGHQRRVAELAAAIGTEMGLDGDRLDGIRLGGLIHDIGKIGVPSEILTRPGRLTPVEYELIKTHSMIGFEIVQPLRFPWPIAEMVRQHHERVDGSGYPDGLVGDQIIVEARILAVADVVESICSHRPYRPALGIDVALDEIERNRGVLFDATAVDACLLLFRDKGYTFE